MRCPRLSHSAHIPPLLQGSDAGRAARCQARGWHHPSALIGGMGGAGDSPSAEPDARRTVRVIAALSSTKRKEPPQPSGLKHKRPDLCLRHSSFPELKQHKAAEKKNGFSGKMSSPPAWDDGRSLPCCAARTGCPFLHGAVCSHLTQYFVDIRACI